MCILYVRIYYCSWTAKRQRKRKSNRSKRLCLLTWIDHATRVRLFGKSDLKEEVGNSIFSEHIQFKKKKIGKNSVINEFFLEKLRKFTWIPFVVYTLIIVDCRNRHSDHKRYVWRSNFYKHVIFLRSLRFAREFSVRERGYVLHSG